MGAATARAPLSVLVVDDDRDTVDSLALILEIWGHQVFKAVDGFAALEVCLARSPDVVVLDLAMPGLEGNRVAQRLTAMGGVRPLIIVMSGYGREAERKLAREAGCDHYLMKPADLDDLKAILANARPNVPINQGDPNQTAELQAMTEGAQ
jgi:DNA-binding response OmpR family regulator